MTPAGAVLQAVARLDAARVVVLIDGGAGAGKTTLAEQVVAGWAGPVQLVGMDSLYPGWDGLAAGSAIVAEQVLRLVDPGYTRWDWGRSAPAEWVSLDPRVSLVVEGCGALTPRNRQRAHLGVWCELPATERRRRAIARDGEVFAAHWDQWEAQEAAHWSAHRPWEFADLVIDPVSQL